MAEKSGGDSFVQYFGNSFDKIAISAVFLPYGLGLCNLSFFQEKAKEAPIFIKVIEQPVHNFFNFLFRRERPVQNFLELIAEGIKARCFYGFQQLLFAAEMDVEASLGHTGLGRDLIHGDFSGSCACHQVHHSLLNRVSGYLVKYPFSLYFSFCHPMFSKLVTDKS